MPPKDHEDQGHEALPPAAEVLSLEAIKMPPVCTNVQSPMGLHSRGLGWAEGSQVRTCEVCRDSRAEASPPQA